MAVSEQRFYDPGKLDRWFVSGSVLLLVSIVWLIAVDYDRPWHRFQDRYFANKAAVAHLEYLHATNEQHLAEVRVAKRRLHDAEELLARTDAARRSRLLRERVEATHVFRKADAAWSQAAQMLRTTRYAHECMLGEFGPGHPRSDATRQALRRQERRVVERLKTKEYAAGRARRIERELTQIEAPVRVAREKLRTVQQPAEEAGRRSRQYRGVLSDIGLLGGTPLVKTAINFPLLDFVAPRDTPGRYQVNQIASPDLHQDHGRTATFSTEHCTTCHIGIADRAFSKEALRQTLEEGLVGINDTLRRSGFPPLDAPSPPTGAEAKPSSGVGIAPATGDERAAHQDAYFEELLDLVNGYLERTGRETIELSQPILAHPNLDLYVSANSPHPMAVMGCTVCHEGNGQATDFVLAAHTPPTREIETDWERFYHVRRAGIAGTTFKTVTRDWNWPMVPRGRFDAGCGKCHQAAGPSARAGRETKPRPGTRTRARVVIGRRWRPSGVGDSVLKATGRALPDSGGLDDVSSGKARPDWRLLMPPNCTHRFSADRALVFLDT